MPEYEFRIRQEKINELVAEYIQKNEVPDLPYTSGERALMTAFASYALGGGIILSGELIETLDKEAANRTQQGTHVGS